MIAAIMPRKRQRIQPKWCQNPECPLDGRGRAHRRGLCAHCYNDLDVRRKFLKVLHQSKKLETLGPGRKPDAPLPANVDPGSESKFKILEERVRRRQSLFPGRDFDSGTDSTLRYIPTEYLWQYQARRLKLPERLQFLMRRAGYKPFTLAKASGMGLARISHYLHGYRVPPWKAAVAMARALECSPELILMAPDRSRYGPGEFLQAIDAPEPPVCDLNGEEFDD